MTSASDEMLICHHRLASKNFRIYGSKELNRSLFIRRDKPTLNRKHFSQGRLLFQCGIMTNFTMQHFCYVFLMKNQLIFSEAADNFTPRGKCPNTQFFLARIQGNKDQKKLYIWKLSTQYYSSCYYHGVNLRMEAQPSESLLSMRNVFNGYA